MHPPTPSELSIDYLEKHGYKCVNVEHSPRIPGKPELLITRDLFGFVDIVALKDHALLVQTTSETNVNARMRKIVCSEWLEPCKRAGFLIHVHGWGAHGLRVIDMTLAVPDWSAIVRMKHKGHLARQEDLGL